MARPPVDHGRLDRPHARGDVADDSIENVRLLIFGGEACPPELATRLAAEGREVWNTYGPTEATVVACAAPLDGDGPVRIGLPLDGWTLAVVDAEGERVAEGEVGELIIGGVGLARYLDPAKDAREVRAHAFARLGPRIPLRRSRPLRDARGSSSRVVPTTRSRSAAAASSSARSSPRCRSCPA